MMSIKLAWVAFKYCAGSGGRINFFLGVLYGILDLDSTSVSKSLV
jgi:hypothetical protein